MSENTDPRLSLDGRATYRITLQGLLDLSWADELGNLRVRHTYKTGKAPVTTLTGEVADQAALSGVLNLVYSLGFPLISVTYLDQAK
jgi:hypothetical protein